MIERTLFTPDHESFRDSFRRFMEKEIAPFHADWEDQGYVAREVWNKAGQNGFLCMTMPEKYARPGKRARTQTPRNTHRFCGAACPNM